MIAIYRIRERVASAWIGDWYKESARTRYLSRNST